MKFEKVDLSRTSIQIGTHPQVSVHKSWSKVNECRTSIFSKSLSQQNRICFLKHSDSPLDKSNLSLIVLLTLEYSVKTNSTEIAESLFVEMYNLSKLLHNKIVVTNLIFADTTAEELNYVREMEKR
jgi:hypothetical protein